MTRWMGNWERGGTGGRVDRTKTATPAALSIGDRTLKKPAIKLPLGALI